MSPEFAENTPPDALRDEIIAAQQQGSEMQRWKIIASAAIVATVLGLGGDKESRPVSPYILCAIPPLCLFADMMCGQIGVRIAVIAGYLRSRRDRYELYVAKEASGWPFWIEPIGALVSSFVLCAFVYFYPWLSFHMGQADAAIPASYCARWLQGTAAIGFGCCFVVVWLLPHLAVGHLKRKA